jgi:metal-responsive CopG/Arc/MetJ family transcriptional regulator
MLSNASFATRRITVVVSQDLVQRLDQTATHLGISRNQLIRESLDQHLAQIEHQELLARLEQGYRVYAERDLALSEEFAHADYEVLLQDV